MESVISDPIDIVADRILGQRPFRAEILGSGASSKAWRICCDNGDYVIRMPLRNSKRPITYRSEHQILHALHGQGQVVPAPISTSFDAAFSTADDTSFWSLTGAVSGQPIGTGAMSAEVAADLGHFLSALHDLPCSGYGRLTETEARLRGGQRTTIEGIRARWCWASVWPFDLSDLSRHPVTRLAPDMLDMLLLMQPELWRIAMSSQRVINHSDLYGEHIFVDQGRLSGVIDFGAAFVAVPGWDFAVLAYYHGWESVKKVLEAYTASYSLRREVWQQAVYLAHVIALYKLDKTVRSKPNNQEIEQIIQFLRTIPPQLDTANI